MLRRQSGSKNWAYYNYAIENESTIWGSTVERKTKGYIAQEIDRIVKRKHDSARS